MSMKMNGYSPVPSPDGTKETYWETKAPGSEVLSSYVVEFLLKVASLRFLTSKAKDRTRWAV
jgi:hypothetical protein